MSAKPKSIGSDLKKVDAHIIQPEEYEELPELTDEFFDRAEEYVGRKRVRRGRPSVESPKQAVTIRYDADVVAAFKASGKGWQTRMNEALKDWLKTHTPA